MHPNLARVNRVGRVARCGGGAAAGTPVNTLTKPFVFWLENQLFRTFSDTATGNNLPAGPAKKDTWRMRMTWTRSGSNPRLVYANHLMDAGTADERTGLPDMTVLHAALEYPLGVLHEITFRGGSLSVTLANGEVQESDPVRGVSFVEGEYFWVRTYAESAGAALPTVATTATSSGLGQSNDETDHVLDEADPTTVFAPAVDDDDVILVYPVGPIAVTGDRDPYPMVCILGDSITAFEDGTAAPGYSALGFIANPLLTAGYEVFHCGSPGEMLAGFYSQRNNGAGPGAVQTPAFGSPVRSLIARHCGKVALAFGANDLRSGWTTAQFWEIMGRVISENLTGADVWLHTITPYFYSTDGWTTLVNQTDVGHWSKVRDANVLIRTDSASVGAAGYQDTAAPVTHDASTGKWKVTGGPYTDDGLHPNDAGVDLMSTGVTPSVYGTLPPVADFDIDPTSGAPPLSVDLTDTTTRGPTAWAWYTRVNGTTPWGSPVSTSQNPTVVFADEDTYDIRLVVTNAAGSDEKVVLGAVTVASAPTLPGSVTSPLVHLVADPAGMFTDAAMTVSAGNGDAVYSLKDLTGNGYNAKQATAANRGAATLAGGKWNVTLDGTNDRYLFDSTVALTGDFEFWLVGNPTAGGTKAFASNPAGGHLEVIGLGSIIADWFQVYNPVHGSAGTLRFVDLTASAGTLRAFGVSRSGSTVTLYNGSTVLGTGTVDGVIHLTDFLGYIGGEFAGPWHELVICSTAQSGSARTDLLAAFTSRWGVP